MRDLFVYTANMHISSTIPKLILLLFFLLASCASDPLPKGEFWSCKAASELNQTETSPNEYWGHVSGVQYNAREAALKKCLWEHPFDCYIVSCIAVPEVK